MITPLHRVFASIWVVYLIALTSYLYFGPHLWWTDLMLFGVFAVVEGIAVFYTKRVLVDGVPRTLRDTLSQFMTYVAKMTHPGTRWYQSWNALVVLIAAHLSWMVARNATEHLVFQTMVFLLMLGYLVFHWLRPDKTG